MCRRADADLLVARLLVARVVALRLQVAFHFAFEVGARHIVQQELEAHANPLAVTLLQMGAELVESAVDPRAVDRAGVEVEQLVARGGVEPAFGHAQLGALRAKSRDGELHRGVRPAD